MTFGELITDLRIEKGLTQKDLSDILNVSRPTISNYESDVHYPDIENLIKIADYFEIALDYLLGRIKFKIDLKQINSLYTTDNNKPILTGEVLKEILDLSVESRNGLIEYIKLLKLKDNSK